MKFCNICDRLLDKSTKTGELKFHCATCAETIDSTPEDTLMHVQNIKNNSTILPYKLIKNAPFAQTIPRVYNTCPKCKNPIVSYIRTGDDFRQLFSCSCGNYW